MIQEIKKYLGNSKFEVIKTIRIKEGVHVYRAKLDGEYVVVKYFEKEEDKREILNYKLLNELSILTMNVIKYEESFIVLEDINYSELWRLGEPEDLSNKKVAFNLATWYFDFHEKGLNYENLNSMYNETDYITKDNLQDLINKFPEGKEVFSYIIDNLDKLKKYIAETTKTFNYNDFYWTNILVSKDENLAIPYDYNFLGSGFRYNDIKNVCSSLSPDAGEVFLKEYNRLYKEKYGYDRNQEEIEEIKIYNVTSIIFALISAFKREVLPEWADEVKKEVIDGTLLKHANILFDTKKY